MRKEVKEKKTRAFEARRISKHKDIAVKTLAKVGTVAAAARACGVQRCRIYEWMTDDPDFKARMRAAQEELTDRLEARAIRMAEDEKKPDGEMLRFLLRGKRPDQYERSKYVSNTQINIGTGAAGAGMDDHAQIGPESSAMLRRIRLMCMGAFPEAEAAAQEDRERADQQQSLPMIDQPAGSETPDNGNGRAGGYGHDPDA